LYHASLGHESLYVDGGFLDYNDRRALGRGGSIALRGRSRDREGLLIAVVDSVSKLLEGVGLRSGLVLLFFFVALFELGGPVVIDVFVLGGRRVVSAWLRSSR
jgi:hypothetical protein